jgi:hypothetical protein
MASVCRRPIESGQSSSRRKVDPGGGDGRELAAVRFRFCDFLLKPVGDF